MQCSLFAVSLRVVLLLFNTSCLSPLILLSHPPKQIGQLSDTIKDVAEGEFPFHRLNEAAKHDSKVKPAFDLEA